MPKHQANERDAGFKGGAEKGLDGRGVTLAEQGTWTNTLLDGLLDRAALKARLKYTQATCALNVGPSWCYWGDWTACLNVFSPRVRGFCRKHFGVALNRCGPLLQLQYYLLHLNAPPHPPTPGHIVCSRLTHVAQREPSNHQDETSLFDLKHFGVPLQAGKMKTCPCCIRLRGPSISRHLNGVSIRLVEKPVLGKDSFRCRSSAVYLDFSSGLLSFSECRSTVLLWVSKQSRGIKGPLASSVSLTFRRMYVCVFLRHWESLVYINPHFSRLFLSHHSGLNGEFPTWTSLKKPYLTYKRYITFFLLSLACGAATNQRMYITFFGSMDILMTEGSLHALFCCRPCCY